MAHRKKTQIILVKYFIYLIFSRQLKEREIEMLELCKSDSESEEEAPEVDKLEEVTFEVSKPNTEEADASLTSENNPVQLINACKNLMSMFQDEEKCSTTEENVSEDVESTFPIHSNTLSNQELETCPQNSEDTKMINQNEDSDIGAVSESVNKISPEKSIIALDTSSSGFTEQSNVVSSVVNYDEILTEEEAWDEEMETELNTEVDYVNSRLNDDENSTEMFDSEVLFPDKNIEHKSGSLHSKTQPDGKHSIKIVHLRT